MASIDPSAGRRRLLGAGLSLALHMAIGLALVWTWASTPTPSEPAAVVVSLIRVENPAPAPDPAPTPARKAEAKAPPKPKTKTTVAKRSPTPAHIHARQAPASAPEDLASEVAELSEGQIAGAARAGSGGGGGGGVCDMAARVQSALRRDPLVRAAAASLMGRAALVWNGDWVRSHGQDGKGLAAVREAILWEVGFAPKDCRAQPVQGLVLLTLGEGGPRLVLGTGRWRWSDLLRTASILK